MNRCMCAKGVWYTLSKSSAGVTLDQSTKPRFPKTKLQKKSAKMKSLNWAMDPPAHSLAWRWSWVWRTKDAHLSFCKYRARVGLTHAHERHKPYTNILYKLKNEQWHRFLCLVHPLCCLLTVDVERRIYSYDYVFLCVRRFPSTGNGGSEQCPK